MLLVASDVLGLPNIVDNHVQNFFTTLLLDKRYAASDVAAISGRCSCSAMASTSSSVKPHNPTQSSSVIIFAIAADRRTNHKAWARALSASC